MISRRFGLLLLLAVLSPAVQLPAQELTVSGKVEQPLKLTAEALAQMPRTSVTFDDHGTPVKYEGVLLHEILKRAGVPHGDKLRGAAMSLAVVASASDGYHAVFALAETDPGIQASSILVAVKSAGQSLPEKIGPFRLVVPHDKRGARSVRMLTSITVVDTRP